MKRVTTTFVAGLWLGLCLAAGSASGQTVRAIADARVGSATASVSPESTVSTGYSITPRTLFTPVDYYETVSDGVAFASLLSNSSWISVNPGGTSGGFLLSGAVEVSLGAGQGTATASDSFDVTLEVSGLGANETVKFKFLGDFVNTFSTAEASLVGPGVNLSYGGSASWNTFVNFTNGTYTLSLDATTSLVGFGPDSGELAYLALLDRVLLPGDMCDEAIPVEAGTTLVSTVGMRGQSNLPASCEEGYGVTVHHDAFFTYEATATGVATVHTCSPDTTFDTRLAVFGGTCDDLALIACNDDSAQCGISSFLTFPTVRGERYIIRLGSYDGSSGTAGLTVVPAIPNDECGNATPISEGTTLVTTEGATGQSELSSACHEGAGTSMSNDAFFTYVSTADSAVTIYTCSPNTTFNTRLAVYTGECNDLTLVTCNDDSGFCTTLSIVEFEATCGEQYLIQLGSPDGSTGVADLIVSQFGTCQSLCPADVDGDGTVSAADMAILLGQWAGHGAADLDGSGAVDSADLAILLGAWGVCP